MWLAVTTGRVIRVPVSLEAVVGLTGAGVRASPLLSDGGMVIRTFDGLVRYARR